MTEQILIAHREILWNLSHPSNAVLMYALMVLSMVVAGAGIYSRATLWSRGKVYAGLDPLSVKMLLLRCVDLLRNGLLQRKVLRTRAGAIAHLLIYIGFLVLLFTTTMVLIDHDFGIRIYRGDFYLGVTLASDLFGLGLILGVLLMAHRRMIARTDLVHTRWADHLVLAGLTLLCVQGFLLEALRIHATMDPWALWSPVGYAISQLLWPFSTRAITSVHFALWWFHTLTVFGFIALLPYTKFFHLLASSANLFFERVKFSKGALPSPGDIEAIIEKGDEITFGLGSISDYSWKQLLELDACTSCGRCQDVCPAYLSGKPLSPKWVVLDARNHMLALHADRPVEAAILPTALEKVDRSLLNFLLSSSGLIRQDTHRVYADGGSFRAENPLVQKSARLLGGSSDARIAGDVMDPAVFWSCTTCMACVQACPVGINHVDMIVGNRQNMTLMHAEVPHEAQATLRALENRANPYGAPDDRIKWLGDLDVPILKPGDAVDYLYWVGCVSAYDPRKQKIARALVKIMRAAGLKFGILGTAEGCTGDPARRLGEENLFQSLAKKNLELLRSISFSTLVANCPHCFNTIKNEYPQFGNLADGRSPEIIHHSVLLRRLLAEKKLTVRDLDDTYTFHDPCYLGRYNAEYEAPRATLGSVKGLKIIEMEKSRENGMCCGAGGGHFWMDLKVGSRVNELRTEQAAATGAKKIATACPFCMQMMEDGVKLTNREESHTVKDIAEVIADQLI